MHFLEHFRSSETCNPERRASKPHLHVWDLMLGKSPRALIGACLVVQEASAFNGKVQLP